MNKKLKDLKAMVSLSLIIAILTFLSTAKATEKKGKCEYIYIKGARKCSNLRQPEKKKFRCEDGKGIRKCSNLGRLEEKKGNLSGAIGWYTQACNEREFRGCYHLGRIQKKRGNIEGARQLYSKACSNGEMKGCLQLGDLAAKNNPKEARRNYEKACNNLELEACYSLGMLEKRQKNIIEAKKWLKRGCDLGFNYSCSELKKINN